MGNVGSAFKVKSSLKIIPTFWGILFLLQVYGAEISDFALPSSPSIKAGSHHLSKLKTSLLFRKVPIN